MSYRWTAYEYEARVEPKGTVIATGELNLILVETTRQITASEENLVKATAMAVISCSVAACFKNFKTQEHWLTLPVRSSPSRHSPGFQPAVLSEVLLGLNHEFRMLPKQNMSNITLAPGGNSGVS